MKPYRFHEFNTPTHAPFNNLPLLWFTIVGEFLAPIVKDEKDLLYWFCFHGNDFQLCFVADDHKKIEGKIEAQKEKLGITSKTTPTDNARIEFAGNSRFIAKDKIGKIDAEDRRAELVLRLLHSTCELLLDQLVKDGGYWRLEKNEDNQNPLKNSFESILHLISNMSQAEFEVELGLLYRTTWMPPQKVPPLRCRL
jgi:hypothetical protein